MYADLDCHFYLLNNFFLVCYAHLKRQRFLIIKAFNKDEGDK